MPEKGETDGAAPELIGFIVKALREYEQEMDDLIGRLEEAKTEQQDINQNLCRKAQRIDGKLSDLENCIEKLKTAPIQSAVYPSNVSREAQTKNSVSQPTQLLVVKCVRWEDFRDFASEADKVAFNCGDAAAAFSIEALKGNRLFSFAGETPAEAELLKDWLTQELSMHQASSVFVGSMKSPDREKRGLGSC